MAPINQCVPYKEPNAAHVTGQASADVVAKRFLAISGDIKPDGSLSVAHATTGRPVGVAAYDAKAGSKVGIIRGPRTVLPVLAAANMPAGTEVGPDAQGRAIAAGANPAAGYLETAATSGQDARVCLY